MTFTPKTDSDLVREAKDILDAFVEKANELRVNRSITFNFSMNPGNPGEAITLTTFVALKTVDAAPVQTPTQDNAPTPPAPTLPVAELPPLST